MSGEIRKRETAVSEDGDVVLITRTNVRSENPDNQGRIHTFHVGTILRSTTLPVGSRFAGKHLRVVGPVEDILRLAEEAGFDLRTPAEIPDSDLSELELLHRKIARLEQAARNQNTNPLVVARPRVGVPALQPHQSEK